MIVRKTISEDLIFEGPLFGQIYVDAQNTSNYNYTWGTMNSRIVTTYDLEYYYVPAPDDINLIGKLAILNTGVIEERGHPIAKANLLTYYNGKIHVIDEFENSFIAIPHDIEDELLGVIIAPAKRGNITQWLAMKVRPYKIVVFGLADTQKNGIVDFLEWKPVMKIGDEFKTVVALGESVVDEITSQVVEMSPLKLHLITSELERRMKPYFEFGKAVGYRHFEHAVVIETTLKHVR